MIRSLALAIVTLYLAYLGWRIADERRDVAARVDAIVGTADPDELSLPRRRIPMLVSKDKTLRAWLATAYLGTNRARRVTGFADGARTWFGKPLRDLSDREFLSLVAILPAPDRTKPTRDPAALAKRVSRIERLLSGRCQPTGLRDVALRGCA